MAKKIHKIDRFEGGINTFFDQRDIPDNSLVNARNVSFDALGRMRLLGGAREMSSIPSSDISVSDPGQGLYTTVLGNHDIQSLNSTSNDFTNDGTDWEINNNDAATAFTINPGSLLTNSGK